MWKLIHVMRVKNERALAAARAHFVVLPNERRHFKCARRDKTSRGDVVTTARER